MKKMYKLFKNTQNYTIILPYVIFSAIGLKRIRFILALSEALFIFGERVNL